MSPSPLPYQSILTVELSSAKLGTILRRTKLSGGGGGRERGEREERITAFKAIKSKNGRFVHS